MDIRVREMMRPFLQMVEIVSKYYVTMCNRNAVTDNDVELAMKYCAQKYIEDIPVTEMTRVISNYVVPRQDAFDGDPFALYSGDNDIIESIHEAYDEFDDWVPGTDHLEIVKNSILGTEFPKINIAD